jgi:hypothetical protein
MTFSPNSVFADKSFQGVCAAPMTELPDAAGQKSECRGSSSHKIVAPESSRQNTDQSCQNVAAELPPGAAGFVVCFVGLDPAERAGDVAL